VIDHRTIHRHFKSADPILAKIVKDVGPCTLKPRRDRFKTLAQAIISQQISTGAAKSIRLKLEKRLEPDGVRPETLARLSIDQLREVGLSRQKAGYMLDLAQKCGDGVVQLSRLGRMTDENVIEQLVQVKGIGRWSAQMFLIFALGRLDVFPLDDFGVQSAIHRLYGFDESPGKATYLQIGAGWRPFASIGSWYCWRFLELNPKRKS
jgi:DNA-3-methyladenine glycosylase II